MTTNYLSNYLAGGRQTWAHWLTNHPHTDTTNHWILSLSAAKLELGLLAHVGVALTQLGSAVRVLAQHTAVDEYAWRDNDKLAAYEQVSPVTCVQWLLAGVHDSAAHTLPATLKAAFADQRFAHVDVNIMPLSTWQRAHKLALFDMDSTLIEQEVIVELAKRAGIGEQVNAITEAAMRGEIDFSESFTRRVALLDGLPAAVIDDIIAQDITLSRGGKRLISTLKAHGYHTVLVSGGFLPFARHVQAQLGLDEVYANALDVQDGKIRGEVVAPIVDGARKAQILQEAAARLAISTSQVVAVGDGANDLPMLATADVGIAYHAKPVVRAQADYAINHSGLDGVLPLLGLPVAAP